MFLSSCGERILTSSEGAVPLFLLLGARLVMQNRALLKLRQIIMVSLEL